MQNKPSKKTRSRAEILAEIAALPPSIQGTISSYRCPRKNGPPAVYYNLQYTLNGKNHSKAIPVGMVTEFKNALASGKKLRDLVLELSEADTRFLVEQSSALEKSSRTSS
ncbi:MAG: hypothetical protein ACI4R9_01115 [Kiritimatiellia bacterium]